MTIADRPRLRIARAAVTVGAATVTLLTGCSSSTTSGASRTASSVTPAVASTAGTSASTHASQTAAIGSGAVPPATGVRSPGGSPSPARVPAGFVGTWYGHSRVLVIGADGRVSLDFRTDRFCTTTRTTGCDRIKGNALLDGGHVRGHVMAVLDTTTVRVEVTSSSAPDRFAVAPFVLGQDVRNHALAPRDGGFAHVPFCADGAPVGYCGA